MATAAKVNNGRAVQKDDLGDEKNPLIEDGPYNIAGVLGEINYELAIASAAYYRQRRVLVIDERNRIPLSRKQEQDDYGETMFEERDYAGLLAEDFRLGLRCAANGVQHCRDMMIEMVDAKEPPLDIWGFGRSSQTYSLGGSDVRSAVTLTTPTSPRCHPSVRLSRSSARSKP